MAVVAFEGYQLKISEADETQAVQDIRVLPTRQLLNHESPIAWAELQWRVSLPILVPILVAIALPLSRVNPRQGRFIKMLPGILLYLLYLTLLTSGRSAIEERSDLPPWVGLWWVHVLFLGVAIFLNKWPSWSWALGQRRALRREVVCDS